MTPCGSRQSLDARETYLYLCSAAVFTKRLEILSKFTCIKNASRDTSIQKINNINSSSTTCSSSSCRHKTQTSLRFHIHCSLLSSFVSSLSFPPSFAPSSPSSFSPSATLPGSRMLMTKERRDSHCSCCYRSNNHRHYFSRVSDSCRSPVVALGAGHSHLEAGCLRHCRCCRRSNNHHRFSRVWNSCPNSVVVLEAGHNDLEAGHTRLTAHNHLEVVQIHVEAGHKVLETGCNYPVAPRSSASELVLVPWRVGSLAWELVSQAERPLVPSCRIDPSLFSLGHTLVALRHNLGNLLQSQSLLPFQGLSYFAAP